MLNRFIGRIATAVIFTATMLFTATQAAPPEILGTLAGTLVAAATPPNPPVKRGPPVVTPPVKRGPPPFLPVPLGRGPVASPSTP
jgi:hypothetical protein